MDNPLKLAFQPRNLPVARRQDYPSSTRPEPFPPRIYNQTIPNGKNQTIPNFKDSRDR